MPVWCTCLNTSYFLWQEENLTDQLRSILAQLDYSYQINQLESEGVNFHSHMYVAEVHPETKTTFCEHEDEAHILKVTT